MADRPNTGEEREGGRLSLGSADTLAPSVICAQQGNMQERSQPDGTPQDNDIKHPKSRANEQFLAFGRMSRLQEEEEEGQAGNGSGKDEDVFAFAPRTYIRGMFTLLSLTLSSTIG